MYTLRILTKNHETLNFNLGESYTVSHKGSFAFDEKTEGMGGSLKENIKSVIMGENGVNAIVTSDQTYFVMTDSGKTFERL
jgi:hypothetical protein